MKKIINFILSSFIVICFTSCEMFMIDNYDEPDQTLWGEIIDKGTGQRMLTDQGSEGVRIRLLELSWSDTPEPFDFWCMKEGIFQNTKVFAGYYNVQVDGPFIPLIRRNSQGELLADESWYDYIKGGTTKIRFEVEPFLRLEWVGEPVVTEDRRIQCSFKVTRGVSEEVFRQKIEPMGGWNNNFTEVANLYLFVSESPSCGYREGRNYGWDTAEPAFSGNAFETKYGFGNTITLTSNVIPAGRTVFVRNGARIRYSTLSVQRSNYNEIKRVDIPR